VLRKIKFVKRVRQKGGKIEQSICDAMCPTNSGKWQIKKKGNKGKNAVSAPALHSNHILWLS